MNPELENYAKHIHFHDALIPDWTISLLTDSKSLNLIDLGCGDGAILASLEKAGLLSGHSVTALDASETRIARVRQMLPNMTALLGDVTDLNALSSSSFDFVMSHQVIEHVDDDQKMLNEAFRILKPGGKIYLSTVFKKWYGWYFYRNQGHWRLDPTHVREYESDEELLPKFKKAGFELLRFRKTLFKYSLSDFVLKRIGFKQNAYDNKVLQALRRVQVPIVGYYNWEIEGLKV